MVVTASCCSAACQLSHRRRRSAAMNRSATSLSAAKSSALCGHSGTQLLVSGQDSTAFK